MKSTKYNLCGHLVYVQSEDRNKHQDNQSSNDKKMFSESEDSCILPVNK